MKKQVDLYQIFYKDGIPNLDTARGISGMDPDCIHVDTRHITEQDVSPIYENYHILNLYPEFDGADYYGNTSYRMYEKTGLTAAIINNFINNHEANAYVYHSSGGLSKAPADIAAGVKRIIALKVFKDPNVAKKWVNVYANFFIADKATWDRYIPVLKKVIELTKTDAQLKSLLAKTYRFRGKDFPLTCFVLEYLFGLFLADNPDIKWLHITPKSGGDLHKVYQKHKAPAGFGDKGTLHHYIDTYNSLFSKFKNKPCTLLEIGVFHGHSLRMWREFLPKARIIGIDIQKPTLDIKGCEFHLCSQDDEATLNRIFKNIKFDIIIDDGSHLLEHQIITHKIMFPKVNTGGLYVIEDVGGVTNQADRDIKYLKTVLGNCTVYDTRALSKRYDDILMVWDK